MYKDLKKELKYLGSYIDGQFEISTNVSVRKTHKKDPKFSKSFAIGDRNDLTEYLNSNVSYKLQHI
jgi:hypothetical protein